MKPTKVRIDGRKYTVHFEPSHDLVSEYRGRCIHGAHRLTVANDQPLRAQKETLLHEILHVIDQNRGLGLDEKGINALSNGVFAVLRDNPAVLAWLTGENRR